MENSIVNITNHLISMPSVTADLPKCQLIIDWCHDLLARQEVAACILTSAERPILVWGQTELSQTRWLINSHLDVVPGESIQFESVIKKGKIWGRGAADTKAGCAIILASASKWHALAAKKNITFMLVTDEEMGGPSTNKILKFMPNLQGGIFLEPTNIRMVTQAKGIMQLQITVRGKAAHGSRLWEGKSALEELSAMLTKFRFHHPSPQKETRNTTFNFSLCQSGNAINQVPEEAKLWCDIRWSPHDRPQRIIKDFAKYFPDAKIDVLVNESPIECPKESELLTSFSNAMKQASINPLTAFEHGSSDARHCTARNIPALVFGPKGKNLHGKDEWVNIKSIEQVSKVLELWVYNI